MLSIEEALEETSPPHAHRPEGRAWQLRGTHGGLFYRGGGGLLSVKSTPTRPR